MGANRGGCDACARVGSRLNTLNCVLAIFKTEIENVCSGPEADHNEFAFAIFPSMMALGFTVRFWVSRSTAINPNFGV
jgi:hypothetical protein